MLHGCYMLCLCYRVANAVLMLQVATCCVHVAGFYMLCSCCSLLHAVFMLQVATCCVHVAGLLFAVCVYCRDEEYELLELWRGTGRSGEQIANLYLTAIERRRQRFLKECTSNSVTGAVDMFVSTRPESTNDSVTGGHVCEYPARKH